MKCELAQQNIALAVYGELPDDESHSLELHLSTCARCQEEYEAVRALQRAMAFAPVEEPSANLLAQTRMRLEEALDHMPPASWLQRFRQAVTGGVVTLGRAPVAASSLLALGMGLGGFSGFYFAQRVPYFAQRVPPATAPVASAEPGELDEPVQVANVSGIVRDPSSENVEVRYDKLVPETARGSLDDPQIRQLLLMAAQSRLDPGVQQKSVSLLAEACRSGHECADGSVRKALLVALRYDESPAVRLKALNGLEPYVAEDTRVRDSILEALMHDPDPGVRSRAIELLEPVQADSSVRQVLHTVASEDNNPHIRTVSRQVLDQLPEIQ